ncbi:MAG TPA: hypothetical protein VFO76_07965 [Candidatus Kapabacteria bacterium]|nr:hypothetical protein [Candidatus Kapabacteria bacterium]
MLPSAALYQDLDFRFGLQLLLPQNFDLNITLTNTAVPPFPTRAAGLFGSLPIGNNPLQEWAICLPVIGPPTWTVVHDPMLPDRVYYIFPAYQDLPCPGDPNIQLHGYEELDANIIPVDAPVIQYNQKGRIKKYTQIFHFQRAGTIDTTNITIEMTAVGAGGPENKRQFTWWKK